MRQLDYHIIKADYYTKIINFIPFLLNLHKKKINKIGLILHNKVIMSHNNLFIIYLFINRCTAFSYSIIQKYVYTKFNLK